jgi:hypothetical protein
VVLAVVAVVVALREHLVAAQELLGKVLQAVLVKQMQLLTEVQAAAAVLLRLVLMEMVAGMVVLAVRVHHRQLVALRLITLVGVVGRELQRVGLEVQVVVAQEVHLLLERLAQLILAVAAAAGMVALQAAQAGLEL